MTTLTDAFTGAVREVHWGEGMLLLPQHLQAAQRQTESMLNLYSGCGAPFSWGVERLVISDARLRNGEVAIERCRIRLASGTWILIPENTSVAPRPIGDWLKNSPDGLIVYLGVPRLHEVRPNATSENKPGGPPVRHLIETHELLDENTGENPRTIEVHSIRAQLFYGPEQSTPGFEVFPLVRLFLSGEEGGVTRRDDAYLPPLLRVGASDFLSRMVADVFHETRARSKELAEEAERREMSLASGVGEHTERLLLLHVLNEAATFFRQMIAVPEIRPFRAYCELARFAGQLSIFDSKRLAMEYPIYDHLRIGEVFGELCKHIRELLKNAGGQSVKWRDFGPRSRGEGMQVVLEEEWLGKGNEVFVGVLSQTKDVGALEKLFKELDWKIASVDDVDDAFDRGLAALELRPVYARPGGLPPEWKFFQVVPDERRWASVLKSKTLAMRFSPAAQPKLEGIRFRVYVVIPRGNP